MLVAAGEELCVCELDAVTDVGESGLSHALSALVDAGLVADRRDGRWKRYRATNRAAALVTVLDGSATDVRGHRWAFPDAPAGTVSPAVL